MIRAHPLEPPTAPGPCRRLGPCSCPWLAQSHRLVQRRFTPSTGIISVWVVHSEPGSNEPICVPCMIYTQAVPRKSPRRCGQAGCHSILSNLPFFSYFSIPFPLGAGFSSFIHSFLSEQEPLAVEQSPADPNPVLSAKENTDLIIQLHNWRVTKSSSSCK